MILPPYVIDVRVHEAGQKSHRVWFPFVLLWPLLFAIVALALVITVLIDLLLLLAAQPYHHYTALLVGLGRLVAETRGTQAHIAGTDALIDIDIY